MHALVIEDDDAVAEHMQFCLEQLGYSVALALDGMAALERCKEQMFEWIICDLRLPRLNGFSFIRQLRHVSPGVASRIIVISSMDDTAVKSEAFSAGAESFLVKPVTAQMLQDALNKPQP